MRKILCTSYESFWIIPNDLAHIYLKIEKTGKMGQHFHFIKKINKNVSILLKDKKDIFKRSEIWKHNKTHRGILVKITFETLNYFLSFSFDIRFISVSYSVGFRMYLLTKIGKRNMQVRMTSLFFNYWLGNRQMQIFRAIFAVILLINYF